MQHYLSLAFQPGLPETPNFEINGSGSRPIPAPAPTPTPGLWIRIHFMRIQIQQFFLLLNQIWIKKIMKSFLKL